MKVAVIGSTGKVGTCLVNELKGRGHDVTGIARSAPAADPGIPIKLADANDPAALADAIRGHDAVMLSGRFVSVDASAVIDALQKANIARLLVVGGAGSLFVSPGVQLVDTGLIPEPFLPEVTGGRAFLETLKASALDWSFLSPAVNFVPGERTGRYRLGGDDLMRDEKGESRISYEDLAKALVDELEQPSHIRARFSIAY
jgi:putative NADH-flavin reductase